MPTLTGSSSARALVNAGGMVAANHHLAAQTGAEILELGGHAVDAAVATSLTLGVVEPAMSGLGGRAYLVVGTATGDDYLVDGHEIAARSARESEVYTEAPAAGPSKGAPPDLDLLAHRSVSTPGALAALWRAHTDLGRMPWEHVVAPAEEIAKHGFDVDLTLAQHSRASYGKILASGSDIREVLPGGMPLAQGSRMVRPHLASSLGFIRRHGDSAFYRGQIGRAILQEIERGNGFLEVSDLEEYQPTIWPKCVTTTFAGRTIHGLPGASGSSTLFEILNLVEATGASDLKSGTPEYLSLLAEIFTASFQDRWRLVEDEQFAEAFEHLVSKDYAAKRARDLRPPSQANATDMAPLAKPVPKRDQGSHTSHISVVDSEGNAVSLTQSIVGVFGSGVIARGTGIILNDAMRNFSGVRGSVNAYRPGARAAHYGCPIVVKRYGRPQFVLGGAGGSFIVTGLAQVLVDTLARGVPLDEAMQSPRIHWDGHYLLADPALGEHVLKELADRGHPLIPTPWNGPDPVFARLNGIEVVSDRGHLGAYEPRVAAGVAWPNAN